LPTSEPLTPTIYIDALANSGAGVGRTSSGKTVFVHGALPGELVRYDLVHSHKRFDEGLLTEVVEGSAERCAAACPYAGVCGGCPWQVLEREAQLVWKRRSVVDALVRIGGWNADEAEGLVGACVAPGPAWGYRNKVEFEVAAEARSLRLGLHGAGDGAVVAVKRCLLAPKAVAEAPGKLAGALGYALGSGGQDAGLLRVGVRASARTHDVEVALWGTPGAMARSMVAKVVDTALAATSVVRVLVKGAPGARQVSKVEVLGGAGSWSERVGEERMRFSAPSFFQVNTAGAEVLVGAVLEGVRELLGSGGAGGGHVCDLYCGAGTFTLPLAREFGTVLGVERAGSSVRDLRRNLQAAGLDGQVEVTGGDVGRELDVLGGAAAVVCDPPRAGLAGEVRDALVHSRVKGLVYVSCDPGTLARDLRELCGGGFELLRVLPVDLFAQTPHVESVAVLARSGAAAAAGAL
jgi:23S rRNA (uracil1939-C5)-methyltransferase